MSLIINFDSSAMLNMQTFWSNHLRGLGIFKEQLNLPGQMSDVINEINNWITSNGLSKL